MTEIRECPTCGQPLPSTDTIAFDHEVGVVIANGRAACFTKTEADLFAVLLNRMPQVVPTESLFSQLYQLRTDEEPEIKIVDVFICKMNKKLRGTALRIESAWGRGKRLVRDERCQAA